MNWGNKIAIVYSIFVIIIVAMVWISFSHPTDLVSKDYYAQELAYQQKIDAIQREHQLDTSIQTQWVDSGLWIMYPQSVQGIDFKGKISLYCPSDESKDFQVPLDFNNQGRFFIPKSTWKNGYYQAQLSWENNHHSYYKEFYLSVQ